MVAAFPDIVGLVRAEQVDVSTAREMVRAGDIVIDVRRPEEYARGHIAGSINVPIELLPRGLDGINGQVLTACSMGGRAARAADILVAAGHPAFVIEGGTKAWARAGYPVEPPAAAAWLR